ncbi:hypothetical protein CR513_55075, partial [Mucuna pruriens]
MVTMFINILPAPYYDKVVENVVSNFANLMVVGERIELGIRQEGQNQCRDDRIRLPTGKSKCLFVPNSSRQASSSLHQPTTSALYPSISTVNRGGSSRQLKASIARHKKAAKDVGPNSHAIHRAAPPSARIEAGRNNPSQAPRATISEELRPQRHPIERCWSLKHKVQDLLDGRLLGFQDQGLNVQNNPLSTDRGMAINAISHKNREVVEGASRGEEEENAVEGTTNSACWVEEGTHSSQLREAATASVVYIEGNGNPHPKSLIIHYNSASKPIVPFIIQVLAKLVYNNNSPVEVPDRGNSDNRNKEVHSSPKGHQYSRDQRGDSKWQNLRPRELLIPHSEYELLDQLHKTLACISLLSLLFNSEGHQNLLLKVLNDAHVAQDITLENFEGIINNITVSRHLCFSEDEIPTEGKSHNQLLHIVVKCDNYMIARVLIDNGSSLNVMPKAMLDKLYLTSSTLKISSVVVRAFDASKREVMGEITLPIRIGPTTFDITFQVMDIRPAYNCLLGRPWIHAVGAVLSSLHQKVKFIAYQQLVNMMGEKELMIITPLPTKYVKGDEEALKTSFQALEIVGTTNAEAKGGSPKLSIAAIMAAKVLISNGFQPGKGLGKGLDGIAELVALPKNPRRFGLGYTGAAEKKGPGRRPGKKWIRPDLYRYFTSRCIISPDQVVTIADQPPDLKEWVIPTSQELNNWTDETLPELIDNATLKLNNASESCGQGEGEDSEEEALVEMERGSTTSRGMNEIAATNSQRFEGYIDECGMCGSVRHPPNDCPILQEPPPPFRPQLVQESSLEDLIKQLAMNNI